LIRRKEEAIQELYHVQDQDQEVEDHVLIVIVQDQIIIDVIVVVVVIIIEEVLVVKQQQHHQIIIELVLEDQIVKHIINVIIDHH
jgi:hypothetical protein